MTPAVLHPIVSRVRTDVTAIKLSDGSRWTRQPLDEFALQQHLNGGTPRGCCPIKEGENTCRLALFDLDSHKGETAWPDMAAAARRIADMSALFGLQPTAWRSSGGRGIHLIYLWDDPQDAYSVQQALLQVLLACGLEPGAKGVGAGQVELFPKQYAVDEGEFGNQFILPLSGKSVPLDDAMQPLTREDALLLAWPVSAPVPFVPSPVREQAPSEGVESLDRIAEALSLIPTTDLDYEGWWKIVAAVHEASGGSDEALELAVSWSSDFERHDETFLRERVWPYIKSERRGGAITRATLFAKANEYRPERPLPSAEGFEDVVVAGEARPTRNFTPIPEARHLCTDHANVQRLIRFFGKRLMVAQDRWYGWDGMRWVPDDGGPTRYALYLSKIVDDEAKVWREKTPADAEEAEKNEAIADALSGWSTKCSMRSTIDAALSLAKRVLAADATLLDHNPWLLNCANGTVDLRTGVLKAHDPEDYITKLCPVPYDPGAGATLFEQTLARVHGENVPVIRFVRRWFGYCATASTREQKFVVHWGGGSNGKSTILDVVAEVLGDYAGTAAPGLMTQAQSERHPTELADMQGRRMITAHETEEKAVLREGFVKQATGSDKIKARFMRADFFEFEPTHKLQLLTNHKPVIKGQDTGIWRRVVLLPYKASFGTPEEVATGQAQFPKDMNLAGKLAQEKKGVLAWIVAGAMEWYRDGLNPPDYVLVASSEYRKEQDRILEFLNENCELSPEFECHLTGDVGGGLYQVYEQWCRESGFYALAKTRFLDELARLVPQFSKRTVKVQMVAGRRRDVLCLSGVRLMA